VLLCGAVGDPTTPLRDAPGRSYAMKDVRSVSNCPSCKDVRRCAFCAWKGVEALGDGVACRTRKNRA
jgi:hypothetical protein